MKIWSGNSVLHHLCFVFFQRIHQKLAYIHISPLTIIDKLRSFWYCLLEQGQYLLALCPLYWIRQDFFSYFWFVFHSRPSTSKRNWDINVTKKWTQSWFLCYSQKYYSRWTAVISNFSSLFSIYHEKVLQMRFQHCILSFLKQERQLKTIAKSVRSILIPNPGIVSSFLIVSCKSIVP